MSRRFVRGVALAGRDRVFGRTPARRPREHQPASAPQGRP